MDSTGVLTRYPRAAPRVTIGDGNPFDTRAPKGDNLRAVKLTEKNLKDVAAHLIKTLGKGSVEVLNKRLYLNADWFDVDTWLVEDYDYVLNQITYRAATLLERGKYDLR